MITNLSILAAWTYDLRTGVLTILVPVLLVIVASLRKHLVSWARYAVEGLLYIAGKHLKLKMADRLTLRQYCRQRLDDDTKYMFVPAVHDVRLEIDKAYVPLTLDGGIAQKQITHRELLAQGERLRIIGDPGSGKSSLVKRVLRDACRRSLDGLDGYLPVLIELRSLPEIPALTVDESGEWLLNHVRDHVASTSVYRMSECFDIYLENGRLLVLLDGLDEIPSARYQSVQSAILQLSSLLNLKSPTSKLILTMRTQFHVQVRDDYAREFPGLLRVQDFTPDDIYLFLCRWPFADSSDIMRIYTALSDRPSLRDICRNPLVLSMYVAEDQSSGSLVAPDTRTEFYTKIVEELMIRRRMRQVSQGSAPGKVKEIRLHILGTLALDHLTNHEQPRNQLSWPVAVAVVSKELGKSVEEADTWFRDLSKETGMFTIEREEETYRFVHLTVCEYLAAYQAVRGEADGWASLCRSTMEEITRVRSTERFAEVLPFACSLLHRSVREAAISNVVETGDRLLLLKCFIETRDYHLKSCRVTIRNLVKWLTSKGILWTDEDLKTLQLFVVIVRDAMIMEVDIGLGLTKEEIESELSGLLANHESNLWRILEALFDNDALSALRLSELASIDLSVRFPGIALRGIAQPVFLDYIVKDQLFDHKGRLTNWGVILLEGSLRHRSVATLLRRTSYSGANGPDSCNVSWDFLSPLGKFLLCSLIQEAPERLMFMTHIVRRYCPQFLRARSISRSAEMALGLLSVCILMVGSAYNYVPLGALSAILLVVVLVNNGSVLLARRLLNRPTSLLSIMTSARSTKDVWEKLSPALRVFLSVPSVLERMLVFDLAAQRNMKKHGELMEVFATGAADRWLVDDDVKSIDRILHDTKISGIASCLEYLRR